MLLKASNCRSRFRQLTRWEEFHPLTFSRTLIACLRAELSDIVPWSSFSSTFSIAWTRAKSIRSVSKFFDSAICSAKSKVMEREKIKRRLSEYKVVCKNKLHVKHVMEETATRKSFFLCKKGVFSRSNFQIFCTELFLDNASPLKNGKKRRSESHKQKHTQPKCVRSNTHNVFDGFLPNIEWWHSFKNCYHRLLS